MFSFILTIAFIANSFAHLKATQSVFEKPKGIDTTLKAFMGFCILSTTALAIGVFKTHSIGFLTFLISIGLMAGSFYLFHSTCSVHKNKKLTAIFSDNLPEHLVTQGPYKKIRHPFYTAYLLNYAGAAIAIFQLWALIVFISLYLLYRYAAFLEENKFDTSRLQQDYREYQKSTGLFIPKIN